MISTKRIKGVVVAKLTLAMSLVAGCADWSSTPVRLVEDYGNSVRQLREGQTYDQAKLLYPNPEPLKSYDGNKGERVLERAYRQDIGRPQNVRRQITVGSGSGSGGGSGASGSQ
ncbi:MAG: hypothetical protein ABFS02_08910 [Pseudomonadota bacterium]